jgi:ribosomal protein L11 methyltransferase
MTQSWQARFVLKKEEWLVMDGLLSDIFPALVVKPVRENDPHSPEQICLIFPEKPDEERLLDALNDNFSEFGLKLPEIIIEALPDIDWLQHVYDGLKPIEAGRFFVHGAHVSDIPKDKLAIVIEAAAAFGTGEHPTTKGCLTMFDRVLTTQKPKRILDIGTGSGILAIAAAMILPTETNIAIDIDPPSVRVAASHAASNGVAEKIIFLAGDAFRMPELTENAPYDLVFGNILAQPLIDMADKICGVSSGAILLSGFTTEQSPYVEKPYAKNGWRVHDTVTIDGWVTLWLTK